MQHELVPRRKVKTLVVVGKRTEVVAGSGEEVEVDVFEEREALEPDVAVNPGLKHA